MGFPSKFEIATYWATQPYADTNPFVDLGAPACFACGWFHPRWDRPKKDAARWTAAVLERAHIIARSAGGSQEPSNLLLLCRQCHEDAPMTRDPAMMMRWVANREGWLARETRLLTAEANIFGITEKRVLKILPVDQGMMNRIVAELDPGVHFSSERGARVSLGTIFAIVTRYIEAVEKPQAWR